ncbi:Hypothetical protein PHPALM_13906 [Phytophthora palmivora]|uniref:Uncharacterized protein n=1 Tax=Phytophthora palmivora TaxID=4796 RepID=A0A2P4XWE4_9STRA|nr:Hypothetical protein PHPALM_13906 [Phytophthora palmivora]
MKYPVCYNKANMLSRAPSVFRRPETSVIDDANFVIPRKLVQRVNSPLHELTSTARISPGLKEKYGDLKHEFLEKITVSPDKLASEIVQFYRQSTLLRELHISSCSAGHRIKSTFGEIVGMLARYKMLHDVVMNAALWLVSKYSSNYYIIDAVSATEENSHPDYPISSCKSVLIPVYMKILKH